MFTPKEAILAIAGSQWPIHQCLANFWYIDQSAVSLWDLANGSDLTEHTFSPSNIFCLSHIDFYTRQEKELQPGCASNQACWRCDRICPKPKNFQWASPACTLDMWSQEKRERTFPRLKPPGWLPSTSWLDLELNTIWVDKCGDILPLFASWTLFGHWLRHMAWRRSTSELDITVQSMMKVGSSVP